MALASLQHLVIVNGWSANSTFWDEFGLGLVGAFQVDILDLDQDKTLEDYLTELDQLITSETVLLGWSLGGSLALEYAATRGAKFKALITTQTNPCFVARDDWPDAVNIEDFYSLSGLVESYDRTGLVRRFSRLMITGSERYKIDRSYLKQVYRLDGLPKRSCLESCLNMLHDLDMRQRYSEICIPSLHVFGGKDQLLPANLSSDIAQLNLAHQVSVIPEMAHLPVGAFRSEFQTAINNFVATLT
mgnify:CR=1 FL=1